MAYIQKREKYRWNDKKPISVICDECQNQFDITFKSAEKNKKKNCGKHICCECKGIPFKPQMSSKFWTEEKREKHSEILASSDKYKYAIGDRDTSGKNNGMYGKKASVKTRKKMSKARKKRIGPLSPAWKGGCGTVTRRVKGVIHRKFHWYLNVYRRDGWTCRKCGSKKKIDAHHIEPISRIIKRLTLNIIFKDDEEKIKWLLQQKEITDLDNGITLCRSCHKKEHNNWGSHIPKIRKQVDNVK